MRQIGLLLTIFFLFSKIINSQSVIDSFADGDFSNSPTWQGDTSDWLVVENSTAGPDGNSSYTLRLNAQAAVSGSKYLSVQRVGSWGSEQAWGFWMGRRDQAATASNNSSVWLYSDNSNLLDANISGYRVSFGDNSGGDEIVLERVDNGTATPLIASSAVTNALTDIGFLVRVTRESDNTWILFTSALPTVDGELFSANETPSNSVTTINHGSTVDAIYSLFDNGYMGVVATHTTAEVARTGFEFDQLYFDTSANSPLPVELTTFSAEYANNSVQLNWETATETNNAGFEVQRQNSEWEVLTFVPGAGTTNSPKYYSYNDEDLPNVDKVSYRLRQIDNDGTDAYSKTVEVDLGGVTSVDDEMQFEFALEQNYPNPFNPVTTINFTIPSVVDANFASTTNAKLTVYNLLGQEVRTLVNEAKPAGSYQIQFDASDLPSGIYFYSLTYGNHNQTRKLALLK